MLHMLRIINAASEGVSKPFALLVTIALWLWLAVLALVCELRIHRRYMGGWITVYVNVLGGTLVKATFRDISDRDLYPPATSVLNRCRDCARFHRFIVKTKQITLTSAFCNFSRMSCQLARGQLLGDAEESLEFSS
jgi:hypothetical protein